MWLAGLAGALAFEVCALYLPPSLTQMAENRLLQVIPGALFGYLIDRLQLVGKPALFVALVALQLAVGTLAGLALGPVRRRRWGIRVAAGLALGGLGWMLSAALLGPGTPQAPFAVWGIVAGLAAAEGTYAAGPDRGRRRMLAQGAAALLAVATGAGVLRILAAMGEQATGGAASPSAVAAPSASAVAAPSPSAVAAPGASAAETASPAAAAPALVAAAPAAGDRTAPTATRVLPPAGLAPAVTPDAAFYVVSKNFVDPVLAAPGWSLEVAGNSSLALDYGGLQALPPASRYLTLECISNDVGGHLIGNALWTGVPLGDLLRRVGVPAGATVVTFQGADGYVEFLPLAQAMRPTTLVAYRMNGTPLPSRHGFPARIVTAGSYGMKMPKWLRRIATVPRTPLGYWEAQGWSPSATVRTMSRIDLASGKAIGGVAFAGDRGISRVEVTLDGGRTWLPARLERPLSPDAWVCWYLEPGPLRPGVHTATVRATDGTGRVQSAAATPSFPNGASGLQSVRFVV